MKHQLESKKLSVALASLITAVAAAYSNLPAEVAEQLYSFLERLLTTYLLAQGGVDVVAKFRETPPSSVVLPPTNVVD